MKRFAAAAFAALLLTGGPPIRAALPATQQHVLRFSDGLDIGTLNPLFATTANVTLLASLTMAHFTRYDAQNRLVPELITEIPTPENRGISRDGLTITYRLRRAVRWSDGAPFDASDVVYTVGAILNPSNNVTQRSAWDHVRSATASDPYTVVFHLKSPYAPFASEFFSTFSTSCVLPKHILGSLATINTAPYNALPVGIGPFRFTAFRRGDVVEMEANPYYFRGKPRLTKIVYKIITQDNTLYEQLQTGELDMWAQVTGTFAPRVQQIPGVRVDTLLSPFMAGVHLNVSSPNLGDVRIRRALRLATDRAFILRTANLGVGALAESVVPRIAGHFDAAIRQQPYDPAQAGRLLDAAGWRPGANGMRSKGDVALTLNIALPSGYAPSATTAELLRTMWAKVGIDAEVKAYASSTFFAPLDAGGILQSGKFDAALFSLPIGPFGDVSPYFGCGYIPPRGFNYFRYCDRFADAAMSAYLATYDSRRQATLSRGFQQAIDDDVPMIVTYERSFPYAFTSKLSGFNPSAYGPMDDMLDADVSE